MNHKHFIQEPKEVPPNQNLKSFILPPIHSLGSGIPPGNYQKNFTSIPHSDSRGNERAPHVLEKDHLTSLYIQLSQHVHEIGTIVPMIGRLQHDLCEVHNLVNNLSREVQAIFAGRAMDDHQHVHTSLNSIKQSQHDLTSIKADIKDLKDTFAKANNDPYYYEGIPLGPPAQILNNLPNYVLPNGPVPCVVSSSHNISLYQQIPRGELREPIVNQGKVDFTDRSLGNEQTKDLAVVKSRKLVPAPCPSS